MSRGIQEVIDKAKNICNDLGACGLESEYTINDIRDCFDALEKHSINQDAEILRLNRLIRSWKEAAQQIIDNFCWPRRREGR